jgi:hypothetical protein
MMRTLGIAFFASHIPATLLVDAQALLPSWIFPGFARNMLTDFIARFNDPLMGGALQAPRENLWFLSLIATELILQLPFFFVALYAFLNRREWIRLPLVAYGGFVSATMVPILSELCFATSLHPSQRAALLGMYLPYLVVPAMFVVWGCSGAERLFEVRGRMLKNKGE